MTWFRTPPACRAGLPDLPAGLDLETVRGLVADALRPAHFFAGSPTALEWEHAEREETPWEIFQGRLLDPTHTIARRTFEAWNIFLSDADGRSREPLLSVKLDAATRQLHVVRAIYCYAWEGYHAGDNVYLSRETRKWLRELVGTIDIGGFSSPAELQDELICLLFQAVVGASRLPLTSVENPLPAFSLGRLAYVYQPRQATHEEAGALMTSATDMVERGLHDQLAWREKAKLLEAVLRCVSPQDLADATRLFVSRWQALDHTKPQLLHLLRTLFDEVALSPYTGFVDTTLAFVGHLTSTSYLSTADAVDFLGYLLRHLARHLTAYDLVTFHHRGANYPDALLIDAVVKAYLHLIETDTSLFTAAAGDTESADRRKRLRRRALRQGWLSRRFYEGLPVPEAPTSPGENARVLPPPYVRIPDEQIVLPARRTKRLFDEDPLPRHLGDRTRSVLEESIRDLRQPAESQELGMAVFLDRPLGVHKAPGEPDRTLLLSYEAFSRSVAERRLRYLAGPLALIPEAADLAAYQQALAGLQPSGLPPPGPSPAQPPDRVSLQDCWKVADDFLLLRTTHKSVCEFRAQLDQVAANLVPDALASGEPVLILRGGGDSEFALVLYDAALRPRLELSIEAQAGYVSCGGVEFPAGGLRVVRAWETAGVFLRERE